ncbi:MAG: prolipoprotein diacylglyceryl transferase [Gammaproteobacteria bacterium]|nr:prolipoprotein diacylglyceryl transferase [Gammaproteobacteria bacterium]MDH5729709.1 prolipoprotein diacylglyceryl transferase [Gammaproteobacteria bacterium]
MLIYPKIDPVALDLGPVQIHWYGVMYLIAFGLAWWLGRIRARRPDSGWNDEQVGDIIFYGALGAVLGGRIGYIIFYNFSAFIDNPIILFKVWEGGMSFHGGLIGTIVAMILFARKTNKSFFQVSDFVAPLVPLGYFVGRIGNFINGELWGRAAEVPWAMIFPHVDRLPRHPSMLYQGVLEGLLTFIILWFYTSKNNRPLMSVSGLFLICFGVFRIFNEFFREPDRHLGFIAFGWLTNGQLLSIPMVIAGIIIMWMAFNRDVSEVGEGEPHDMQAVKKNKKKSKSKAKRKKN